MWLTDAAESVPIDEWSRGTRRDRGMPGGHAGGWEMISVRPSSVNSIPSVVMNELTLKTAVMIPFTRPTTMQTSSVMIRLGSSGIPPPTTS